MSVQEFQKQLDSLKGFKKDYQESFNQHEHGFTYGIELLMSLEYDYRVQKIAKFSLSVDGTIGYKWNGTFFAGFIPLYYTIHVQAGLKAQVEFHDLRNGWIDFSKFWEHILLQGHIGLNGELGVGINGFLSVGFFAGAEYGISGYMFMPEFYTEHWKEFLGSDFEWELGVRVNVFLLGEFEFGGGQYYWKDPFTPDQIIERNKEMKTVSFINRPMAKPLSDNIYDGSKPQIEKVGDNYVASWIDVELYNNAPHAVLKYSVYKDGIWSVPQAIHNSGDDFYHDMYFDGKDLHITWQKIKPNANGNSLEQMCKNSEIYYAKFDSNTLAFNYIKPLTDDGVLDAAPRFVLQENPNQPLSIAWQKNTNDDIIGLTGKNSIVYSSLSGGSWSSQKRIYESDHYFSFVDTAYVDGKITSAFMEDMDNDLATDDRKMIVCDATNQIKTVGVGFATVNNPQFYKLDGKVNLTFYGDGKVCYSNDFNTIYEFNVSKDVINDTYKIIDNESKLYIYYNKLSSENISQVFASIYDKTTGKWQIDVCLTDAQNTIMNSSIAVLTNGDILTVYNEKDEKNDTVSLGYNVKEIRKDFAIISAFYDKNVQPGDNFTLSVGIQNTGDYPISRVELSAFGKTESIILEQPLAIGGIVFIDMNCVFDIKSDGKEIIIMRYENIERDYVLHTRLTDMSITGNVRFDSFREYYDLTISNASEFSSKVYIDIYYKGEVIDTVEVFVGGNTAIEYTYSNDDFENGNYVYFVLRTDIPDKYESDNEISFGISNMAEKATAIDNPYYEALQIAKLL